MAPSTDIRLRGAEFAPHRFDCGRGPCLTDSASRRRSMALAEPVGSSRALIESPQSILAIALDPLVAGGPADAVVPTQGFLGVVTAQIVPDKPDALVQRGHLFPGHRNSSSAPMPWQGAGHFPSLRNQPRMDTNKHQFLGRVGLIPEFKRPTPEREKPVL